jgi:hypothetical protein
VSIKGSPHARFRRALDTRNPTLVLAAAAELQRVELHDALAICLILLDGGSARYERAAVRWLARFCLEAPGLGLKETAVVLGGLQALPGEHGEAVGDGLAALFESHGRPQLAEIVARWARQERR